MYLYTLDIDKIMNDNPTWRIHDHYEIFTKGNGNDYYINFLLLEEAYLSGYVDHFLQSESEWLHYNKMIMK